ncbi:hypothetical protein EROM_010690 [Encephalitozoon romaleae SJ-2008]|uniref:Uncharacterized protein n=1 Tax=Encephalitozoon romaleae (strain SJ-2008) TaxID=1178016 RepID=I6ZGV0_ENCRO|nr:hypothetical protein EROM_010690 [Encephalitozoon romaleae SJ-2008]AFN82413.1 hypothetical protein EROM_010690 [Encephalitozoon romaleae SJ-2008]
MDILRKCASLQLACMLMGMIGMGTATKPGESSSSSIYGVSNERKIINNYFSDDQIEKFLEWISKIPNIIKENSSEIKVASGLIKGSRENLSGPVRAIGDVFIRILGTNVNDVKFFKDFFILVLVKLINIPDIIEEVSSALS